MKVQRKQVAFHLQSVMELHLDLACVKLKNTEVKLNDTEETIKKLIEKFDTLQKQMNDTETRLNNFTRET